MVRLAPRARRRARARRGRAVAIASTAPAARRRPPPSRRAPPARPRASARASPPPTRRAPSPDGSSGRSRVDSRRLRRPSGTSSRHAPVAPVHGRSRQRRWSGRGSAARCPPRRSAAPAPSKRDRASSAGVGDALARRARASSPTPGHAQHPAAVRDEPVAVQRGAGVEHERAGRLGLLDPVDRRAACPRARDSRAPATTTVTAAPGRRASSTPARSPPRGRRERAQRGRLERAAAPPASRDRRSGS